MRVFGKMKCTSCGGSELIDCVISAYDSIGEVTSDIRNASTYACRQCGHVGWYLSEQTFKAHDQREKQKAEYRADLVKYEQRKKSLESEIERLRKTITEENQTVKAVNNAKTKLADLEKELKSLLAPSVPCHRIWK